jgi:hypothetical protein
MKPEVKEQRTRMRIRTAVDASGKRYELQEWREMVSVNGSPWEPRQKHGQAMTFSGMELERISSTLWTLGYPPVELTLLE